MQGTSPDHVNVRRPQEVGDRERDNFPVYSTNETQAVAKGLTAQQGGKLVFLGFKRVFF